MTGFPGINKKVLIITSWYPSKASGVSGIFIQDQAQVLSQAYDVRVLVVNLVGWRHILKGEFLFRRSVEQRSNIKVYLQPIFVPPKKFLHFWCWSCIFAARKIFSKIVASWGKPDIIHAHVVLPNGWIAMRLGGQYSIPVVLTEHSGPFSVHLKSEAQKRLVRVILSQVNKLLAVSPALERQINLFQPDVNIDIVGNVIRTDFFTPNNNNIKLGPRQVTRFLSVAMLDENKGIHYLLEAMSLLVRRGISSFEVFIGGEGPAGSKLVNLAMELGLLKQCRFLGMLSREQVKRWMRSCDVFVSPSLGETFGVVLGEAMACGKPVIATACGGPEFVVTPETGLLVEVGNTTALAGAMEKFILGKVVFKRDVIHHSVTERFGVEAFLREVTAIYEQLW